MARNKYPEETVKLIMDTAAQMFMEKGYDQTSLQDIINATNLSKGAIYHHFSSKEDIFEKICLRIRDENATRLSAIRDDKTLNGHEKLRQLFRSAMLHKNQEEIAGVTPYLLDNSRFLAIHIKELFHVTAPDYIAPIIEEGIKDGSIKAEDPEQLAEAIIILTDVWLNPLMQPTSKAETLARCNVFKRIINSMGLDFLDDDVIDSFVSFSTG